MYGFSPDVVRRMTPAQQLMYLESDDEDDVLHFETQAEYEKWKRKQCQ